MKNLIRMPLFIALVLIIARILVEEVGGTPPLTTILGVTWLHFLVPVYLGIRVAREGSSAPFKRLFTAVFYFTLWSRIMVMVTYMLASPLGLRAERFTVAGGGGVGHESALSAILLIPLRNLLFTTLTATILGMIIGWVVLLLVRRRPTAG